eukprot:CAMPEP_0174828896 /NCGR_PEP_ID=MMETSP1114-20130205/1586_1 /TAXON_ID=312471 /ORGANISM="Neobodo designis, Strain CCAP 1951/1" /LENGTH=841 /DNA_ID=CAMNT_0016062627 /DNA_START=263 /DNA_END=2788 /DNA_ORIENTATION=+
MVWEDQGLYFTLIFNSIVVTVGLIVGYVLHKSPDNHRVMRPNRPKSETATLFEGAGDATHVSEEGTLVGVGVQPYMYVSMLKMMAFMFLSLLVTSVTITAVSATDTYLNEFNAEFDPKECRGKSPGDCGDSPFCTSAVGQCWPKMREGLFDFSVANIAPKSWRLYLVAVAAVIGAVFTVLIVKRFAEEIAAVIKRTYITKVHPALPCAGLASVGARTVLVSGIPADSLLLDDIKTVHAYLLADTDGRATLLEDKLPEKEKKDGDDKKDKADEKQEDAKEASVGPEASEPIKDATDAEVIAFDMPAGDADLSANSWVLAQRVDPNTIVSLRGAPDDMIALIEEEKALLEELTDAVASLKQEEDEEKKPKAQEAVDKVKAKLEEVREKLREKVPEVPEQDYTGAVIFTLDRASTAFAFVRNFNAEQPPSSQAVAQVIGHRDGVVWTNLGVSKGLAYARFFVMCVVFTLLVFFWSIPVGFLGSLENLAGLPAVGPPFAWLVRNIPVTILGILTAYLPTIVITVFNILLPSLFRFFGRLGGLKTVDAETRSVILMCAVFSIMSGIVMQAALQGGLSQLAGVISSPNSDTIIALIIAVVSPQGGYWYAYLISAACLGNILKLLLLGPLIVSKIFAKLAGRQAAFDRLFEPRETDYAFLSGRHLFFYAIAMLFHGTVPFLVPFGFLYCILAYAIERSVLIDGGKPDGRTVVDFAFVKAYMHSIVTLYLIAVLGACLVCFLKLNVGAGVISVAAVVGAAACHIVVHRTLAPIVWPEPEAVRDMEAEMDGEPVQPTADEPRYVPDYVTYVMDEEAVAKIEAAEYPAVDTVWHERDGDAPRTPDAALEKA